MNSFDSSCLLYLGTEDGLRTVRVDATGVTEVTSGLEGNAVRAIDVSPDSPADVLVGCGLRGWGLHRTTDGGETFDSLGFDEEWVWGVRRHPSNPGTVYVGTEPPMLYRSTDDGNSFRALSALDDLPSRPDWTFFHEPFYEGHVHGLAVHPERPERIFAGVEHGAVIYSSDGGATWEETLVGTDAHRVAVHPDDPDRVFVAAGSGLYRSDDASGEWTQVDDLAGKYAHAIQFDPRTPERMYVYVDADGMPIYRSDDGGASWTGVGDGLPDASPADTLRLHPENPDVLFYAGDADGGSRVFASPDAGESWERLDPGFPKTWRLAVATPS